MLTITVPDKQKYNGVELSSGAIMNDIVQALKQNNIFGKRYIEGNVLTFTELEPGKLFTSSTSNKIKMKSGDPRIAKLGRDYLETKRLTKKQFETMVYFLVLIFDELGFHADVTYAGMPWRQGTKNYLENIPQPRSFSEEI